MEAVIEKISLVSDKIDIIKLYSVGEKIHDALNNCNQYLRDLKGLIDSINTSEVHPNQMIIFEKISTKKKNNNNSNSFLLYDQINKKFGSEIFIMDENILKTAVNFEVEKIKKYLKAVETLTKLKGYIYIFSKSFI